jgi:hypothetical protein
MGKVFETVSRKIQSGKFSTAQEAREEMGKEMGF